MYKKDQDEKLRIASWPPVGTEQSLSLRSQDAFPSALSSGITDKSKTTLHYIDGRQQHLITPYLGVPNQ